MRSVLTVAFVGFIGLAGCASQAAVDAELPLAAAPGASIGATAVANPVGTADSATVPVVRASAGASAAAPPTASLEGLSVRFFQCDNGAAFTTQYFPDGRFRLNTREGGYDLTASGDAFTGGGLTYRRQGVTATLEGAPGGPYVNCAQR